MKITIVQTVVIIEDDNTPQPKSQPWMHPFLEWMKRFPLEMKHGHDVRRSGEEYEHGTTFTQ